VFVKLECNGMVCAVSGKGNRAIIADAGRFGMHDIDNGASKLVCSIDVDASLRNCALNEDGSEAAFITGDGVLQIMDVSKAVGDKVEPATVIAPEPLGAICQLVYSDGNRLHVVHRGGSVSLLDLSTKTLILIEAPQKGQVAVDAVISPNADYFATLQCVRKDKE
jgi:hypothetical protein